jgi:uncharacterized protein (TIGR00251 family)
MARLDVKVTPRAKRNQIVGWHQHSMVLVRIAAPPVEGKANDELVRFLAEKLGVAPEQVLIIRGHTSRQKVLEVEGVSEAEILRKLQPD